MLDLVNSFPGKNPDEAVYIFARPYFVAFIPTALVFLFIFLISLVIQGGIATGGIGGFTNDIANMIILFIGLFQLFVVIVFFVAIIDFYYDIVIVTDRRMVDIDQEQLLFRSISELNLEEIEDVNSSVAGFLQTLFNYGTITVETAGEQENFIAKNFRNPREIVSIISDLSAQAKKDIPEATRVPNTPIIGVINNTPVSDLATLHQMGALSPDDNRQAPGH